MDRLCAVVRGGAGGGGGDLGPLGRRQARLQPGAAVLISKESSMDKPFLSDVKTLRDRARQHLETGAIGTNYVGDVKTTIKILQEVLATEIVCTLRYTQNAIA